MVHGTVSAAADALHISQPAVSRIIRDLELHLGLDLFERSHGRINPTPSAFDLLEEVERFFISLDLIERTAQEIALGRRIGMIIAAMPALAHTLVPDALGTVLAAHGDLSARVLSMRTVNVVRMVSSRQAHIGITAPNSNLFGLQEVHKLAVPYRCILPAGHPLSVSKNLTLRSLEGYPFIGYSPGTTTGDLFDRLFRDQRIALRSRIDTHLSQMVSAFVQRGLGVAVVDAFTAQEHVAKGGEALPIDLGGHEFEFSIVMRENSKLGKVEQSFIAAVNAVAAKLSDPVPEQV